MLLPIQAIKETLLLYYSLEPRQANRSNVPAENVPEYFKRSITIPFLDFLLSEMTTRFSETNRKQVTSILSLILLVAIDSEPKSDFFKIIPQ